MTMDKSVDMALFSLILSSVLSMPPMSRAFSRATLRAGLRRTLDLVWPRFCLICGLNAPGHPDACAACRAQLPPAEPACRRCALLLQREVERCGHCISAAPAFDAAFAAFAYGPPIASLVQRFKFNRDLAAGRLLAALLAGQLARRGAPRPDLMIPVPLNWRRRWHRGFNQAELLCRDLSRHFDGLPWSDALLRRRATPAQSALPAGKRHGNVRGAFAIRRLPPGVRTVALVDDVMTTGATLAECARVLKRAGVARVEIWVLARA